MHTMGLSLKWFRGFLWVDSTERWMLTSLDDTGRMADCSTHMEAISQYFASLAKISIVEIERTPLGLRLVWFSGCFTVKRSLKDVSFGFLGKACVLLGKLVWWKKPIPSWTIKYRIVGEGIPNNKHKFIALLLHKKPQPASTAAYYHQLVTA